MHPLAGLHQRRRFGLQALAQLVHPDPGGVDDAARLQLQPLAPVAVERLNLQQAATLNIGAGVGVRLDALQLHAIEQQRPSRLGAARHSQRQPRVLELGVPVLDAAAQAQRLHPRQRGLGLLAPQPPGGPKARAAGQPIVELEPDPIKRRLPRLVAGHHEGQRLRQMRRNLEYCLALGQRLAHQGQVALRQIAHPAVQQLGGTRRGAAGEVVRLQQRHPPAALRRLQRHAQTGGTAADDEQIPHRGALQML